MINIDKYIDINKIKEDDLYISSGWIVHDIKIYDSVKYIGNNYIVFKNIPECINKIHCDLKKIKYYLQNDDEYTEIKPKYDIIRYLLIYNEINVLFCLKNKRKNIDAIIFKMNKHMKKYVIEIPKYIRIIESNDKIINILNKK